MFRWLLLPAILLVLVFLATPVRGSAWLQPTETPQSPRDRLVEPTLPASPSQADLGAQAFWLNCMPCHGDRGQGLTDEFRNVYPPEDRNCWTSGCHGNRPYDHGFTLPAQVPALIGPETLLQFPTAGNLFGFINGAMPFQAPGSLDAETYWQITAFLLRENGVVLGPKVLEAENAMQIPFRPPVSTPTPVDRPTPQPSPTTVQPPPTGSNREVGIAAVVLGGIALAGAAVFWFFRGGSQKQ